MSWQAYVDNNLVGTGLINKAAILGHDGSLWAKSPDFDINQNEINAIIAAYKDPSGLQANGFHVGGVKHFFLRGDERTLNGKQGEAGVFCVKTTQAILVGTYIKGVSPGQASVVVEKLGDYLIEVGYVR